MCVGGGRLAAHANVANRLFILPSLFPSLSLCPLTFSTPTPFPWLLLPPLNLPAPHLHISAALSGFIQPLPPSPPTSSDVPRVFPTLYFLATLFLYAVASLPPGPLPLRSSILSPPPLCLFSRALQCRCVGDDVRDAAAGVSNGRVYIRVLQPRGLQPLSGRRQRWVELNSGTREEKKKHE